MARPLKKLTYFPLDVHFESDSKIRRLIMRHGAEAVSVYLVFVGHIYEANGYYLMHSDDKYAELAFVLQLSEEKVKAVLETCLELELFDRGKLDKWGIYTSFGLQMRFNVIKSHLETAIDNRYLLPRMKKLLAENEDVSAKKPPVSTKKPRVSAEKPPVSAAKTPLKEKRNIKGKLNTNKITKTEKHEEGFQANKATAGTTATGADAANRLIELQRLFDAATGEQHV